MALDEVSDLLARIDDVTDVVAARNCSWEELDQIRGACRRLRRAVEIRAISTGTRCIGCDQLFVPLAPGVTACSEACASVTARQALG